VIRFVDLTFLIFYQGLRDMVDLNFLIYNQGPRDIIDLNFLIFHQGPRDMKIRKLSQQKLTLILLDFDFPYCGLRRGVLGSEGFSRFPTPHSLVGSDGFKLFRSSPL